MKRLYNKIKKQDPKQQWSVIPCEEEKRAENDGESGALALYFATPYLIRFCSGIRPVFRVTVRLKVKETFFNNY